MVRLSSRPQPKKWRRKLCKPSTIITVTLLTTLAIQLLAFHYWTRQSRKTTLNTATNNSTATTDTIKKRRLEFVHITKIGGSAIEKVGAESGIMWGACHYMSIDDVGCTTPDIKYTAPDYQSFALTSPWHTPPKLLAKYVTPEMYPYNDADLFAVVRNPYDRIVSEYYCPWEGFQPKFRKGKRKKDPNDPKNLNQWVKQTVYILEGQLKEFKSKQPPKDIKQLVQKKGIDEDPRQLAQKHYLNQAEYIFDGNTQIIKNIVHYEHLQEEFDALMAKYGLNIQMPSKDEGGVYTTNKNDWDNNRNNQRQDRLNAMLGQLGMNNNVKMPTINQDKGKKTNTKRLTFRSLDKGSVALINRFARDDFVRLGYQMVDGFEEGVEYNMDAKLVV